MGCQCSYCLKETADVVDRVDIIKNNGRFQTLNRINLKFGYRSSPFQFMKDLGAIVAVTFQLQPSGSAKRRLQECLERWS